MNKKCVVAALAALMILSGASAENLPIKEILGQEYYTYKVKKGDSVYGIVHRYGWDEAEFLRLNPSAAKGLKKDEILYYPTGRVAVVDIEPSAPASQIPENLPLLVHNVKRGETVYSIAKLYGIPVQTIYDAVPSSKSGIKAGEKITIDQKAAGFGDPERIPFYYQQIKPGDTLYSTAKGLGLTVEEILSSNPGMSETNFRSGDLLKIPVQDQEPKVRREMVEVNQVASISSYKVGKNDTWSSISRKTGVDSDELREANSSIRSLKKDQVLAVPEMETVQVEREVPFTDSREETASGRREIYDSIHHIDTDEKINEVRIALIIEDAANRRDAEFTRGFLLALKQLGDPGFKVNFKVAEAAAEPESLVSEINDFNPQLVLNLSDKGAAEWMVNLGAETGAETLNVFDARSDVYTSTPSLIQLLTPSSYFYDTVSQVLADRYRGIRLLTVSKGGDEDPLTDAIEAAFSSSIGSHVLIDNLNPSLIPSGDILVIADLSDRKDVEQLFSQLAAAREENPLLNATIVGKPNWVTFAESMADKFYENDVLIPSRFYFDPEGEKGKTFIADYTALYDRGPLKSYPNYAATGYDIANCFIPALALNEGDFNVAVPASDYIQMPVSLQRKSNWGGFYNSRSLLVRFTPYRTIDITEL